MNSRRRLADVRSAPHASQSSLRGEARALPLYLDGLRGSLDDAVRMRQFSGFAEGRASAAVLRLRQLDSAGYRRRLYAVSGDDMLDCHLDVEHRVIFRALATHLHIVSGDALALLAQDGDDIHRGAARQSYQQHLHWPKALVVSTTMLGGVEDDVMA